MSALKVIIRFQRLRAALTVKAALMQLNAGAGQRRILHNTRRVRELEKTFAPVASSPSLVTQRAHDAVVWLGEVARALDGPVANRAEDHVGRFGAVRESRQDVAVLAKNFAVLERDVLLAHDGVFALVAELVQSGGEFARRWFDFGPGGGGQRWVIAI